MISFDACMNHYILHVDVDRTPVFVKRTIGCTKHVSSFHLDCTEKSYIRRAIAVFQMSQVVENSVELFNVRCADVGLDCKYIIYGINEEKVIDSTILHMFDYYAINPEEMTMCMKIKIKENIHSSYS